MKNPLPTLLATVFFLSFAGLLSAQEIVVANASFEEPELQVERGAFEDWDSNSLGGTGTWPVARIGVTGEANGNQVAVIHANGFIGQVLREESGAPLLITPGDRLRVSFLNLPINDPSLRPINMGIYLLAANKDGFRIAEAYPFKEPENKPGRKEIDFVVTSEAVLDANVPGGWRSTPVYLMFRNFTGRAVIDEVEVERLQ